MGGKISKKVVGVDEQKQIMAQEAEVTDHHKPDWVSTRKEKKMETLLIFQYLW